MGMRRQHTSQLLIGFWLIAFGLIALAGQFMGQMGLGQLWPVFLIVLGATKWFFPDEADLRRGRHVGGLWLIVVGALLLLNNYRVLTLGQSWPLFIVAAGVAIIIGHRRRLESQKSAEGTDSHG
jgi:hypothetical protein